MSEECDGDLRLDAEAEVKDKLSAGTAESSAVLRFVLLYNLTCTICGMLRGRHQKARRHG